MNLGVKDDKPRQTLGAVREAAPQVKGGFTNSKFGRYSLGRLIKNHVNKNKQPDLGAQDNKNPNKQNNEGKADKNKDKSKKENIDDEEEIVLSLFEDLSSEDTKLKILNAYRKIKNKKYDYSDAIKNDRFFRKLADAVIEFFVNIRTYKNYQDQRKCKGLVGPGKNGKVDTISISNNDGIVRLLVDTDEKLGVNIFLVNKKGSDLLIAAEGKKLIDFQ